MYHKLKNYILILPYLNKRNIESILFFTQNVLITEIYITKKHWPSCLIVFIFIVYVNYKSKINVKATPTALFDLLYYYKIL